MIRQIHACTAKSVNSSVIVLLLYTTDLVKEPGSCTFSKNSNKSWLMNLRFTIYGISSTLQSYPICTGRLWLMQYIIDQVLVKHKQKTAV